MLGHDHKSVRGTGSTYEGPTATPYLLIPSEPGDTGLRPIPAMQAVMNNNIQATITNLTVGTGWTDYEVQLSCIVANLGTMGCFSGLAEFYIGDEFSIYNNAGHEGLTLDRIKAKAQLVGFGDFQAPPGGSSKVICKNLWKPGSSEAARMGVLVQAYDLFTDRMTAPFDAIGDRHVSRNDQISFIVTQGKTTLCSCETLDLDTGIKGDGSSPFDIVWWTVIRKFRLVHVEMEPRNKALITTIGVVDFDEITAARLQNLTYTNIRLIGLNFCRATNVLSDGAVFAVKTKKGNYAKVQVVTYHGSNIDIEWVTYTPPL